MYEMNQAVGQTNLLISKKFERFHRLVEDCEIEKGEKLMITCRDLQGFWDMAYMEVRDCDSRAIWETRTTEIEDGKRKNASLSNL